MTRTTEEKARLGGAQGTLGTFSGVFTPSVLTILGIILFMRLGYVVGEAVAAMIPGSSPWLPQTIAASAAAFLFVFAIFFPAVTGFTQGVSMSGDLKDPGRNLPPGTFLAVGISVVVYFGAALVFLPLRIRCYQPVDPFGERFDALFESLPVVAVVLAAEDIPLDAEPEEGEAGETALVLDKAADASRKAEKASKEAGNAAELVDAALRDLRGKASRDAGEEERAEAEKTVLDAKERAEKAARRAARARAKADDAAEAAKDLEMGHGKTEQKGNGSSPEGRH